MTEPGREEERGALLRGDNPPAFKAPPVIMGLVALLAGIHAARMFLDAQADNQLILTFALFPARYAPTPDGVSYIFPGGIFGDAWSLVTYAFLHGDWLHLLFNAFWLLAFGTPVARRLGAVRFVFFYLLCAILAAIVYAAAQAGLLVPVVGASGAISGVIAGAALFVFAEEGPIARFGFDRGATDLRAIPRRPAHKVLTHGQAMIFSAVWLGLTVLTGLLGIGATGDAAGIAWEAHLAGFIAGLLLFPKFDPGVAAPA